MDRNSLIGMGLIAIVLGVWMWMTAPTQEEIQRKKRMQDSLLKAEQQKDSSALQKTNTPSQTAHAEISASTVAPQIPDSLKEVYKKNYYRDFYPYITGKDTTFILENEKIRFTFVNPGARIQQIELKEFSAYGKKPPLSLLDKDSVVFRLIFNAYQRSRIFFSDSLYFIPEKVSERELFFSLNFPDSSKIGLRYLLPENSYSLQVQFFTQNSGKVLSPTEDQINMQISALLPGLEKHIIKEKETATIYYKFKNSSVDYLNPANDREISLNDDDIEWISFKHQFFNITFLSEEGFMRSGSRAVLQNMPDNSRYVKKLSAELGIPVQHSGVHTWNFYVFASPNHYYTLRDAGHELENMIPLGWSIFSYINRYLVIPLFNGLGNMNMGIVILILSIIMKILLLPIAYKTYLSSVKMKALMPEMEALNKKYENKDPLKKQQEQMQLYQRAGVSPFSGCIPLLIQIPILIALFSFVPAAFELRQKSFLWADDLSTYDSIWDFGYVPFINWAYGDHVSLFALMMFVSTLIYTYMNSHIMPQQNEQMPGMKFMMYFMPVIFLAVMNRYSAGLSWYYFLANILSFLQNWIFKKIINADKIRRQIEENLKKPVKKSSFQKKLEEMARQRQQQMKSRK